MRALARCALVAALVAAGSPAAGQPIAPCLPDQAAIVPPYGDKGHAPTVQIWRDIDLADRNACPGTTSGRMALVVALAARFDGTRSLEDIAARIGAISATEGLRYWSVTDGRWRTLVSESFAIDDPDTRRRRPDFTAREILSGSPFFFVQNDTRSTGRNVYRLSAISVGRDRLVVEIVNLTPIRFTLVTLYEAQALRSLHFFDRQANGDWGYYGISAVRAGAVDGLEKSFVNRAAAFYRFLVGEPPDGAPPLAP